MRVWVVSSMTSSEDETEAQTIHNAPFLETYNQPISMFLPFYMVLLVYFVFDCLVMSSSNEDLILPQVKYPVEKGDLLLLAFL